MNEKTLDIIPKVSEYEIQKAVVQFLELKKCKYTSIPNSTYTRSWSQKMKNKQSGLRAGLPDLFVIYNNHAFFIEMKTPKGIISDYQAEWIREINKTEIKAYVCRSVDDVAKVLEQYESRIY